MATPKQIALRVGVALAIGLLMAQFVRPGLARPPAMADLKAPRSVKQIFRASYYPCHSNELQLWLGSTRSFRHISSWATSRSTLWGGA